MPAYNVAPYIGAAIESVMAQTFTDWELIVVDDGSTDDTGGDRAAPAPPAIARIRLLQQVNGGISAARNIALARRTRRVHRHPRQRRPLGADVPRRAAGRLRARTPKSTSSPATAGSSAAACTDSRRGPIPTRGRSRRCATILGDETSIFIMSVFRRRVYEAIGGFDEALRTNEDYDFWLRAALAGFRFRRNDRPLGHYRRRDDSLSAIDVRMLAGILRVYEKLRPLLQDRPGGAARSSTRRSPGSSASCSPRRRAIALTTGDRHGAAEPPGGALRAGRRRRRRRRQLHGAADAEAAVARLPVAPRPSGGSS